MALDLSDDEKLALVRLRTRAIEDDRYPLSPRSRTLKAILDKLDPPPVVTTKPFPAIRRTDRPRVAVLPRERRRNW